MYNCPFAILDILKVFEKNVFSVNRLNKIIRDNDIKVSQDELKEGVREQLRAQFAQYGIQQADDEMMNDMVDKFMKREDEVRKVNDQLYDNKVMEFFKSKATLKEKKTTSEKFYEELAKQTA